MAYDAILAERVRHEMLNNVPDVEEKERAGGLAFMINDKMFVCVQDNTLLLACDPEQAHELHGHPGVSHYERTGWLIIGPDGTDGKNISFWVKTALAWNSK